MSFLKRLLLLNKRLYKQITYVILLAAIPLSVFTLKALAREGGSLVTIALYAEDPDDAVTKALMTELTSIREEFRFEIYASEATAKRAVGDGTVSEAFIIPADVEDLFKAVASGQKTGSAITIYVREQTVSQLMMQEILESVSFKLLAPYTYKNYLSNRFSDDAKDASDPEAFQTNLMPDTLFTFAYPDETEGADPGFLLSPIRGFLAVLLLVSALAAGIYYLEDLKNGLFIFWHTRFTNIRMLGYYSVVMFNSTVLSLGALYLAGLGGRPGREILLMLMYDLTVVLLSMILVKLLRSIKAIGVAMPLVVVLSLVLSPVFIDFKSMRALEIFVPSFHYLLGVHDSSRVLSLALYCVAEIFILELFELPKFIKNKQLSAKEEEK